MKYIRNNRHKVLPWVTDFTNPQDHIRYSTNVKNMTYTDWFFCHPSAYFLFFIINWYLTGIIMATIGLFTHKAMYIVAAIFFVIGIYKHYEHQHKYKDVTFYDLLVRDYPEDPLKTK